MKTLTVLLCLIVLSGVAPALLYQDCQLYIPYDNTTWTGNNTAPIVTADLSGNGRDGVVMFQDANKGTPGDARALGLTYANTFVTGKFGKALAASGSGAASSTKRLMDTHILGEGLFNDPWGKGQDWSFSFWAKRPYSSTDTGGRRSNTLGSAWVTGYSLDEWEATPGQDETLINWHDWSGGLEYDHINSFVGNTAANRTLTTNYSAGGAQEVDNLGTLWGTGSYPTSSTSVWRNIIITVDGDPAGGETTRFTTTVYVNGVAVAKVSQSGWGWGSMPIEAISMGASQQLKGGDGINEQIDDFGAWSRILTAQEIASISAGTADLLTLGVPEPATLVILGLGAFGLLRRKA